MRLLVLGGSGFVGRVLVDAAVSRGWSVTMYNRGLRPDRPRDAEQIVGDRTRPSNLNMLRRRAWDAVVDTWAGAPRAVADAVSTLSRSADVYAYVSSLSVYRPPPPVGGDELSPTVHATPDATAGSYAECKRGGELAVEAGFGPHVLITRPGVIVGPREDGGRLVWWLLRARRGGQMLAPGPPTLELQLLDARDLAEFILDSLAEGRRGVYNVGSRVGRVTMQRVLDACCRVTGGRAELSWVSPDLIARARLEPWTELPLWLPPDHPYIGMHRADVEAAHAAGLRTRPIEETVAATWQWLLDSNCAPRLRDDLPPVGISPEREERILAQLAGDYSG